MRVRGWARVALFQYCGCLSTVGRVKFSSVPFVYHQKGRFSVHQNRQFNNTGQRAKVTTLMVKKQTLDEDAALGIAGISAPGGITMKSSSEVSSVKKQIRGATSRLPLGVDAPDYNLTLLVGCGQ